MRTKSVEALQAQANEHSLPRTLGPLNLTLLGVGGIIGAGIFVLTGQAAASYAGPAIVLSFILSGIGCVFAALCYAELAALIPVAGSAYTYAYAGLGEFVAWVIGWDLILEYLFGASTVAVGWAAYIASFFKDIGLPIPAILSQSPFVFEPGVGWSQTGAIMNLPAALICLLCTILLLKGIKESATVNNAIVLIKAGVILLFIAFGAKYVHIENLTPFIPENTGKWGEYGWSGIFRGAGVIFFAYIGFDAVSCLAQEAKNPQRDLPIGIIASLAVSTVLYIGVAVVLTGIVPFKLLADPAPVAVAVNAAGAGLLWLRPLVKLGAIAGLSSVVLVLILAQPRIFYSMAHDGLLPKFLAKVSPKTGSPYVGTLITGILSAVFAGLLPIGLLGELVSIGTLLAFVIVCLGVWVLRRTRPELHRPFRTPWVPLVPILGAVASASQMVALPVDTWIRLFVWLVIGFAIYFFYGRKHSVIGKEQAASKLKA